MTDQPVPEISVVVVNYNRKELLVNCLNSLACQRDVRFELVLVDNGSSDESVSAARAFSASAPFHIEIIENKENRGFCGGNNQGILAARGQFIALLNNDAEADPLFLRELRRAFDLPSPSPGPIGMAASKILVWEDPSRIDKAGHLIYLDGQNRGRGSGQRDVGQYDRVEEVLWPDGCAAMYRRDMLNEIGGFDEDLFAYGDDAELGLRARIAGWGCLYIPTAVVRHHRGATLGLLSGRRLELIERNRILLAVKHFPASLLWLNGAYFLARIGAGIAAAARGRGEVSRFPGWQGKWRIVSSLCKANWEAFWMIPSTLRKRRQFRPLRRLSPSQIRQLLSNFRISLKELMENAV